MTEFRTAFLSEAFLWMSEPGTGATGRRGVPTIGRRGRRRYRGSPSRHTWVRLSRWRHSSGPAWADDQLLFGAEDLAGGTGNEALALELTVRNMAHFPRLKFTLDGETFSAAFVSADSGRRIPPYRGDVCPAATPLLYLDGEVVGAAAFNLESVELDQSLFFGMLAPERLDKTFLGNADDLVVAFDALSGDAVFDLANPEFVAADVNGDGLIGSADLDVVRANWGAVVTPGRQGIRRRIRRRPGRQRGISTSSARLGGCSGPAPRPYRSRRRQFLLMVGFVFLCKRRQTRFVP